jgi:hypothetical protein
LYSYSHDFSVSSKLDGHKLTLAIVGLDNAGKTVTARCLEGSKLYTFNSALGLFVQLLCCYEVNMIISFCCLMRNTLWTSTDFNKQFVTGAQVSPAE